MDAGLDVRSGLDALNGEVRRGALALVMERGLGDWLVRLAHRTVEKPSARDAELVRVMNGSDDLAEREAAFREYYAGCRPLYMRRSVPGNGRGRRPCDVLLAFGIAAGREPALVEADLTDGGKYSRAATLRDLGLLTPRLMEEWRLLGGSRIADSSAPVHGPYRPRRTQGGVPTGVTWDEAPVPATVTDDMHERVGALNMELASYARAALLDDDRLGTDLARVLAGAGGSSGPRDRDSSLVDDMNHSPFIWQREAAYRSYVDRHRARFDEAVTSMGGAKRNPHDKLALFDIATRRVDAIDESDPARSEYLPMLVRQSLLTGAEANAIRRRGDACISPAGCIDLPTRSASPARPR
ncbi:hypothetical protein EMO89_00145 [Bifidobacterium tissieri]|uniref:Uncharacterized protein n=1 Tax=Bifidobacterium tissieri TaxID=1630162 RepID=A0A5M9ZWH8_9BIFI|nr:hypothetical protein [Bifidobacterium tissieri]KAA8831974.1 hypothetical protein EMO89_00145 [Bifidobacterium tissieri]